VLSYIQKGKGKSQKPERKIMEKIKLFEMYDETRKARIAAAREKAKDFVENEAIPAMIDAAKNMECSLTIQVPTGLIVENVIEIIAERVEYKNLTRDCRRLKYFWG
jgi:hypothetical protein